MHFLTVKPSRPVYPPAVPVGTPHDPDGADSVTRAIRRQRQVADIYSKWRADQTTETKVAQVVSVVGGVGYRPKRESTSATTESVATSTCSPVVRFFTPTVPASISRSPATKARRAPERSAARIAPLSPRSP
jgi:hypothetical protein